MKPATIPSLPVDPELRESAQRVLKEGETLSAFVESSVRAQIHFRQTQSEFVARGLASRAQAKRTGEYYSAEEVLEHLEGRVAAAKAVLEK
jgi:hypothetical protein